MNKFLDYAVLRHSHRYLRLIAVGSLSTLVYMPIKIMALYFNIKQKNTLRQISQYTVSLNPKIVQVPMTEWGKDPLSVAYVKVTEWFPVFLALLLFVLFGLGEGGRYEARRAVRYARDKLLYMGDSDQSLLKVFFTMNPSNADSLENAEASHSSYHTARTAWSLRTIFIESVVFEPDSVEEAPRETDDMD